MHFIYPFPASRLSPDQLFHAVSAWLTTPTPAAAGGDGGGGEQPSQGTDVFRCSSPTSVPLVFSHEEWFVQYVPALGVVLTDDLQLLLKQEEQQQQQGEEEEDTKCRIRLALRHILTLASRIPEHSRNRDEMRVFIDAFGTLLRCSAQSVCEDANRLAQKMFVILLNRFEPTAQFLLLSRLFQLLTLRELRLSEDVHEPQLMAWLVDIYRTQCYDDKNGGLRRRRAAENGKGTTTTATEEEEDTPSVGKLFRAQLHHLYTQIEPIKFEDPAASVNFYAAVCLLLVGQALHRHRLPLLRRVGPGWLGRVRDQLHDWRTMNETATQQQNAQNQKRDEDDMASELRRQMRREERQQQLNQLNMLLFQLEEAERRVGEALEEEANNGNNK